MENMVYEDRERMRAIHTRVIELRCMGVKTSKGEPMSLAAIARTLDPPVSRPMMTNVVKNVGVSERVRSGIEKELGQTFWFKKGRRVRK